MWTITNKAFEPVYKKYKVKALKELTDKQLKEACTSRTMGLNHTPVFESKTVNGVPNVIVLKKHETIKALIKDKTVKEYVDVNYWDEEDEELDGEAELRRQMIETDMGDTQYELLAEYGLGIYNLKPGESTELKDTERMEEWIEEVLAKLPIAYHLDIINKEKNIRIKIFREEKFTEEKVGRKNVKTKNLTVSIEKVNLLERKNEDKK